MRQTPSGPGLRLLDRLLLESAACTSMWPVAKPGERLSRFGGWVALAVSFAPGCQEDLSAARIPGSVPTSGAYEAEDAFHAGTATFGSSLAGFSGTGYLDALGQANDRVVFAVHSASTG